jgi:hypothetical protein
MLSPTKAATAATAIPEVRAKMPRVARTLATIRAVSPGTGIPADS